VIEMAKISSAIGRIVAGLFIGAVVASNVEILLRTILTDPTVQAPLWMETLFLLGDILVSYWWARLFIWLAKLFWRGMSKIWSRRHRPGALE